MTRIIKATVRSYDAVTATAEVEAVGSHGQYLTVPVATHLDATVITDGKRCAVILFDEHDPGDGVLIATYDDTTLMSSALLANHDHSGDSGDGGTFDAANLTSGLSTDGQVLTSDGAAGAAWEAIPALGDHDHSGDAGDGGTLEVSDALVDTGGTTGHLLTVQADDSIAAAALADHDHSGDAGDGGQIAATDLDSGLTAADLTLIADGSGGCYFTTLEVLDFFSGAATDGQVLTADGSGNVGWEAVPGATEAWTWGEWSSTSWDGDAKTTAANGTIDLSAVFGLPAGITAISLRLVSKSATDGADSRICKDAAGANWGVDSRSPDANEFGSNAGIVQCDANGDVYFRCSHDMTNVYLYINGYLS